MSIYTPFEIRCFQLFQRLWSRNGIPPRSKLTHLESFIKLMRKYFIFRRVAHGDSTMLRLSLPSNVQAPTKLTIFGWRPTWMRIANSRMSAILSCWSAFSKKGKNMQRTLPLSRLIYPLIANILYREAREGPIGHKNRKNRGQYML